MQVDIITFKMASQSLGTIHLRLATYSREMDSQMKVETRRRGYNCSDKQHHDRSSIGLVTKAAL